jgi:hypothetical protein
LVASALMWAGCYFIVVRFEGMPKMMVLALDMAAALIIYFGSLFILFNKDFHYLLFLFKNKFKVA